MPGRGPRPVADVLASPIVKTLPGKAAVPDDHPLTIGGIGLLGTAPSEEAMEACDTLFMVGTNFPYTKHLPEPGQARCVQLEADPIRRATASPPKCRSSAMRRRRWPRCCRCLTRKVDRGFLEMAQKAMDEWRERMDALASITTMTRSSRSTSCAVVDRLAADDAILTSDSGTIATWSARHFDIRGDRAVLPLGEPRDDGARPAVRDRGAVAYPGRQVHRVRR